MAVKRRWKGPKAFVRHLVPIGSVKPDKKNARDHDKRNIDTIKTSFDVNGQVQLLVVYKSVAKAGNARLKAAKLLKWTHVAVVDVTDHFESEEQATAFALMDNKSAELASWNFEQVQRHFKTLHEEWHPMTGFADFEIEPLIQGMFRPKKQGDMPEDENKGVSFWSTHAQAAIIRRAIDKLKTAEADEDMSDGRALELMSGEFLAG